METLTDNVRDALGIGGKSRAFADSVEKARQTMHSNVRRAYNAILPQAPTLAAHLKQAIKIAAWCSYAPIPLTTWVVTKRPP
jgi:autotransporter adhesin